MGNQFSSTVISLKQNYYGTNNPWEGGLLAADLNQGCTECSERTLLAGDGGEKCFHKRPPEVYFCASLSAKKEQSKLVLQNDTGMVQRGRML